MPSICRQILPVAVPRKPQSHPNRIPVRLVFGKVVATRTIDANGGSRLTDTTD